MRRIFGVAFGLLLLTAEVKADFDMQGFCEGCVQANTDRAEWGLSLRREMLATCQDQDMRVCSDPYKNLLIQQELADNQYREKLFARGDVDARSRLLIAYADHQKASASWLALRGVRQTSSQIVEMLLNECRQMIASEVEVAENGDYMQNQAGPICQDPLDDVQYLDSCTSAE